MAAEQKYEIKTLKQCWEQFASALPSSLSHEDLFKAKLAFFAGAGYMFDQTVAIGEPGVSEADGVSHMEGLGRELKDFAASLSV